MKAAETVAIKSPLGRASLAGPITLAAMSLGYGVIQLDVTIVNVGLDKIGASLGGTVATLQWVVSAYTIAFAALIPTAGALGDRFGAKRVFVIGFAIFTAASFVCAVTPTAAILITARLVQGFGAAILVPNSLALLNHTYRDERRRGRAVAIWAAGASLALTAGPLVGGVLIEFIGWRSIFFVNVPIGLCGLFLTCRYARETPSADGRELDLPGQVFAIAALGFLAAAIIRAGAAGWTDWEVVTGFVCAIAMALLFAFRELHARQPMLPLWLFRRRLFTLTSAIGLLVNVAFYGLMFVLSLYFQRVMGLSPLETGFAFLPMMAAVLTTNLVSAQITERLGARIVISVGAAVTAAGCAALLGLTRHTGYTAMAVQLVAMGGGLGLLVPPLTSTLLGSVEKDKSGIASGVLNSARQSGSVLGVALFGSLLTGAGGYTAGTREALGISTALLMIATVLVWVCWRSAHENSL